MYYICMCVFTYVRMYYICMYVCMYVCMCVCMYLYIYVYIYIYVCVCVRVCVCACVRACVRACVCGHVQMFGVILFSVKCLTPMTDLNKEKDDIRSSYLLLIVCFR